MLSRLKLFALLLCLLPAASVVWAQRFTISGYVTDADSGEPLIGVAVYDSASKLGTVTGNSGFYSISLTGGQKTVVFSCLGFEVAEKTFALGSNMDLNVQLSVASDMIEGATVTSHVGELGVSGTQMSAIEVPVAQIKTIPAIGGEVDVIKALQLLPGVQSGSEGTAGLYVRGGGADENLLLMDGVPLYNVNHLLGFFSVFNADAVKNVTMYKGSFPARFGGHLSSVIDVRLNDGNDSEYHGAASIGLISSKINFEGPIVKGRTTFNVSARRTYMDLLAKPVIAYANRNNYDGPDDYEKYGGGYDFYDLNLKLTHRFNNDDRLSVSFYSGDDAASVKMEDSYDRDNYSFDPVTYQSIPDGTKTIERGDNNIGWRWGNLMTAVRWNHRISPKLFMSANASYTRYRSKLGVSISETSFTRAGSSETDREALRAGVGYNSMIDDISAGVDFEWHPNPQNDVKAGAYYTRHKFNPGVISLSQEFDSEYIEDGGMDLDAEFGDDPIFSDEAAIYAEDNWSVTPWLKANLGFRTSMYAVGKSRYFSFEPRVSARALLNDNLSLKASYSEMGQYIHLLCNSNLSLPSDLWVPVTENIRPMRSRQVAAGVFYDRGNYEFSVEAYRKTMDNVLEYKDGASYFGLSSSWEEKVSMGRGLAWGVEFLVQKKTGKTTGWIGYTLARTTRIFDRPGNVINDGRPFPAKYDRRHDLSATVTHKFSKRFDLSATFIFASGNCGSLYFDDIPVKELEGTAESAGFIDDGWGYSAGYLSGRNNYRMPAYNRLDIGMNFYRERKHGTSIWNISVYNAYNRLNPFIVFPDTHYEYNEKTNTGKEWPVLKQLSIFPIIPTVSYTFKF